jgi:hypothetical protein
MSQRLEIPFESITLHATVYPAAGDAPSLLLAHGAGAGQQSRFITAFAEALVTRGVGVVTFDFPYMQQHRRVPDRGPLLEAAWRAVLTHTVTEGVVTQGRFVIGGKSMGGRIASQVLADRTAFQEGVRGLVLLGYPLHPPGRPDQLRTAHLPSLAAPVLIVQGERDAFGTPREVREAFAVSQGPVEVLSVPGGDHSFKVPKTGGPQGVADERIRERVADWVNLVVRSA